MKSKTKFSKSHKHIATNPSNPTSKITKTNTATHSPETKKPKTRTDQNPESQPENIQPTKISNPNSKPQQQKKNPWKKRETLTEQCMSTNETQQHANEIRFQNRRLGFSGGLFVQPMTRAENGEGVLKLVCSITSSVAKAKAKVKTKAPTSN